MNTDIAIIGLAGRFPDAQNINQLFDNLKVGRDSVREISAERIKKTTLQPDTEYSRRGYIEGIDMFDYSLFNISLGEAVTMDPHQRILLETVYETIENAGYSIDEFSGSNTGVFVADTKLNYYEHADEFIPTLLTGNISEFIASRINRIFNLSGGASMIDTSCSSSLVALHYAVNDVILGNVEQALVCAANLELFPVRNEHDFEIASIDGKSKPFSAQANGMAYGEVVACVLIKPLERAIEDHDNIQAIIKATAINNNANRAASMTAPDSIAQAEVIQKAWKRANLNPTQIGYIEAHGSGTQLGDSIEVGGLSLAFSAYTQEKKCIPISTIKSNIGHARVAAGMAGLVKAVLALKHQSLFPSINFEEPSKVIDFENSAVYVNDTYKKWEKSGNTPRIAAVSSMGLSGTNAHVVLQEAPEIKVLKSQFEENIFAISAKTADGLKRNIADFKAFLGKNSQISLDNLSFTLLSGRKHYKHRFACVADTVSKLLLNLDNEPVVQTQPQKYIYVFSEVSKIADSDINTFNRFKVFNINYHKCLALCATKPNENVKVFAFQYAFYKLLEALGVLMDNIVSVGIGKMVISAIKEECLLNEAIKQVEEKNFTPVENIEERVQRLLEKESSNNSIFISVLPHCPIGNEIRSCISSKTDTTLQYSEPTQSLSTFNQLIKCFYEAGFDINWKPLFNLDEVYRIELPTYNFEKIRCWIRETPKKLFQIDAKKPESINILVEKDSSVFESKIAEFWIEHLKDITQISVEDNFFELGGDSLKATHVINKINKYYALRIDFEDLFDFPTLRQLATYVESSLSSFSQVTSFWKETLKCESIKPEDDFFELGGHSLMANQVINRINKTFKLALNFEDFFSNPTLQQLSDLVDKRRTGKKEDESISLTTFTNGIQPTEEKGTYALSNSQHRIWVLSQFQAGTVAYNNSFAFNLSGLLNKDILSEAFDYIVNRHEILRTNFIKIDETPQQVIRKASKGTFKLKFHDFTDMDEKDSMLDKLLIHQKSKAFNLEKDLLIRGALIKMGVDKYAIILTIHHIISDEWSIRILFEELVKIYNQLNQKKPVSLPKLPIQYKDYVYWQQQQIENSALATAKSYWHKRLEGELPVVDLPADFARPTLRTFEGGHVRGLISADTYEKVLSFSRENNATAFMTILSNLYTLLYHYTSQRDLIVGTPVAGRNHADLESQIGLYINTIALRNTINPEAGFKHLLQEVKSNTFNDFSNQHFPFDKLVEDITTSRDLSRSPIFDVFFNYQAASNSESKIIMSGVEITTHELDEQNSKFDLTFFVKELANKTAVITIEFDRSIYTAPRINKMLNHFINLLDAAVSDSLTPLSQLNYLSIQETEELISLNETEKVFADQATLVSLFADQVKQTPDAIALIEGEKQWSYTALDEWSNQICNYLREECEVQIGEKIGMHVERSGWMVACLYGILKSGAAYVPLETNYPTERKKYIIEDSSLRVLMVSDAESITEISNSLKYIVSPSDITPKATNHTTIPFDSTQSAYVIYTSGSTGQPKGVELAHRGIVNRIEWMKNAYGFNQTDVVLQKTPYVFDVSVWEFFMTLSYGGKLVTCQRDDVYNPKQLVSLIEKNAITTLHFVPGMYQVFLESIADTEFKKIQTIRQVFTSGEALSVTTVKRHHSQVGWAKLHNLYGPTEASVDVSYYETTGNEEIIPIGKPIQNICLWVLGEGMELKPKGVKGEIWIGGVGLAKGYVNKPELTNKVFVDVPNFGRIYRSGDIGRWNESNDIEYLGRQDNQVKVRGHRIELGEVERAITGVFGVEQVVVLLHKDENLEQNLVGCYITSLCTKITYTEWVSALSNVLPGYMIPSYMIEMHQMPTNANGKVDRKQIAKIIEPQLKGIADELESNEQLSEIEMRVKEIFEEILKKVSLKLSSNFFQLGGDSIKAIRLINLLNKEFAIALEVKDVYLKQDIGALSALVSEVKNLTYRNTKRIEATEKMDKFKSDLLKNYQVQQALPTDLEDIYPMSEIEKGMVYHNLLDEGEGIYQDQFFYQFKDESFDFNLFKKSLVLLVEKHEILRSSFNISLYEEPLQIVHQFSDKNVSISFENIADLHRQQQTSLIEEFILTDRKNGFNLKKSGLFRARIYQLSADEFGLLWIFHHAILDGWSNASLMTELSNVYFELKKDANFKPERLNVSYKDYVIEQTIVKADEANFTYWKEHLAKAKPSRLPLKSFDKSAQQFAGVDYSLKIEESLQQKIVRFAQENKVPLSQVYLAAFCYTIKQYNLASDEVLIGLVSNNRPDINDSDKVLGCFLNTVPFKVNIPTNSTGISLMKLVSNQVIQQKTYDKLPLNLIQKAVAKNRHSESLFDIHFSYIDFHVYDASHDDTQATEAIIRSFESTNALFDFMINNTGKTSTIILKHQPDFYSEIERNAIFETYLNSLNEIIEGTAELKSLVNKEEASKDTEVSNFIQQFEKVAKQTPQKTAIIDSKVSLTYEELDNRANAVAQQLLDQYKVVNNDVVAVLIPRSELALVSMLGILKSGAAFLPIDANYPEKRIKEIIKDANPKAILSNKKVDFLNHSNVWIINKIEFEGEAPKINNKESDLAYVIYTSGSTGKPKGVEIEHKNLNNYLEWANSYYYKPNFSYNYGFFTSLSFDLSITPVFTTLLRGDTIYILSDENIEETLKEVFVLNKNITAVKLTPSHISLLSYLNFDSTHIEHLIVGGEQLLPSQVETLKRLNPRIQIYNEYGPTETTVGCTVALIDSSDDIHIGKPIAETNIYILNENFEEVEEGELYIGGKGVGRGYRNNRELTQKKFLTLDIAPNERVYASGDLAKKLPDGNYIMKGRVDDQVKINGYRIELSEIERVLASYEAIDAVTVMYDDGNRKLVAYYKASHELDKISLKKYLVESLPSFMIPQGFVFVSEMPLTFNGKIDKKKLIANQNLNQGKIEGDTTSNLHQKSLEKALIDSFQIICNHRLSPSEDYWSLGIDSIKAVQIAARLKDKGFKIFIRTILKNNTIAEIIDDFEKSNVGNNTTKLFVNQPSLTTIQSSNDTVKFTEVLTESELNSLFE